jgi:hypothetical protein
MITCATYLKIERKRYVLAEVNEVGRVISTDFHSEVTLNARIAA